MTVPNGNMGCQLSRRGIQNYILRSIGPNNSEPVQIVLDWIRTFRTCFKKAQFNKQIAVIVENITELEDARVYLNGVKEHYENQKY